MKFNLIINPAHTWENSNSHALKLVQSLINNGHEIQSVFFYGDSSRIAENTKLQLAWLQLIQQQQFDLLICSTMIEINTIKTQLKPGFKMVGMSQLAFDMELSDKIVEIV